MRPNSLRDWLHYPAMGKLLEQRAFCRALIAAGFTQLALHACDLPTFTCSFYEVTGVQCPGCGLTRGVSALLRGQWEQALRWHLFSPLALLAMLLILAGSVAPDRLYSRIVLWVSDLERRTCMTQVGFLLLWVYTIVRACRSHNLI